MQRRRHPGTADLLTRRLSVVLDEALACAAYDIPEYPGGTVHEMPGAWLGSDGARRMATLLVLAKRFAQLLLGWADDIEADDPQGRRGSPRMKKSTVKGEAREKILAALTLLHKYQGGGCMNQEPIGVNELARQAQVSPGSVANFFDKEFGGDDHASGHQKYKAVCRDVGRLAESLKVLNGGFSPHELYGRNPPGEGNRDDDE